MATPKATIQFRNAEDLVQFYQDEEIPAFGIRNGSTLNFKYEGPDLEEGKAKLVGILNLMLANKTAAIYTLALYNRFDNEITEKTPASLSVNFRLNEYGENIGGFTGGGGNSDIMQELKSMRKEIEDLKKEKEEPADKLGMIGEIMQMDAVQPVILAIAGLIADKISSIGAKISPAPAPSTDLRRVSGPPGWHGTWREDPEILISIDTLADKLEDFPDVMAKLARIALNKPVQFAMLTGMLRKMKV